jgi:Na+-translocating ferredoxin:NAD+ oxidoreductase RnfC subunit
MDRLGITEYSKHLPFVEGTLTSKMLTLPLKMHIGAPCEPIVAVGDHVQVGQLIAKIPEKALGTNLHAPMSGVVRSVDGSIVIETA